MFNRSEFFAAFAQHGLLVDVVYAPLEGEPIIFQAGFKSPEELMLGDGVVSQEYELELEVATSPTVREGESVSIGGEVYTLRHDPRARGDGTFAIARLTKVAA